MGLPYEHDCYFTELEKVDVVFWVNSWIWECMVRMFKVGRAFY